MFPVKRNYTFLAPRFPGHLQLFPCDLEVTTYTCYNMISTHSCWLKFFLLLKTILRTISFHKLSQSPPHSHSCLRNPSLLSVHNLLSVHLSQSTVNPFLSPLQSQALQKEGTLGVCCTAKETTLLCRLGKLPTAAATCPRVTPPSWSLHKCHANTMLSTLFQIKST